MKLGGNAGNGTFAYVPYGKLHAAHEAEVRKPRIPGRWLEARSREQFDAWIEVVHNQVRDGLWPTWDAAQRTWRGAAAAFMDPLTEWDLRVMAGLAEVLDEPVSPRGGGLRHVDLFDREDNRGGRPGDGLAEYHALLDPAATRYEPTEIFVTGLQMMCGSTALLLKARFQRPRAFHVAYRRGANQDVPRLYASTSDTPSMISGHCYEGALAGTWTARRHFMWVRPVADRWREVKPRLQQWVMDIGDRRVMAQVHYPSDNIASWWTALMQLQQMREANACGAEWMYEFLRDAIPASRVYQAIERNPPPLGITLWGRLQRLVSDR